MNLETLLVIVAVVVAAVFNVILPWLKKLQEEALAGNAGPELQEAPTPALAPVPTASPMPTPMPTPEFGTRRTAPTRTTALLPSAVARPTRRSRLGSLSGMRDGIVLTVVLGPCRAQTPFV